MAESDWELGSGFALDGMTVTVGDLEFTHDNKLGPNACAYFKFTECVDADGNEAEDQEQKFTVGKNYDNAKDGASLVGSGKINENTNFGILLGSVKGLFESVAEAVEAVPNPKEAESWIGTRWTLGTITRQTKNPTTGEVKEDASKFVFTEYHGRGEEAAEAPAPKKAAASTSKRVGAPAKAAPKAAKADDSLDDGVLDAMMAVVNDADERFDSEDDWQDAVLELDEVKASRPAQKAILRDGATYWAAYQAAA